MLFWHCNQRIGQHMATTSKIWLITGVSSGFGLSLALAVLAAGDVVVGSVREAEQGEAFVQAMGGSASFVVMDVTNAAQREAAVAEVLSKQGRIDVLVNNAGYGFFGAVEEASDAEARHQMEVNFFGALALTQLVLPAMRAQKSGHVVQISSIAGISGTQGLGLYNASKFALEGFSEALAQEAAPLGIKVTLVEPGPFRTEWAGGSSVRSAKQIAAYAPTAHETYNVINGYSGKQPGDPDKGAKLIVEAVKSANPPLHLPLGKMAVDRMRSKLASLGREVDVWEAKSVATAFDA